MTTKQMKPSVFSMADVNNIVTLPVEEGKQYVMSIYKANEGSLNDSGKIKILNMVKIARNSFDIAKRVSDFILAHPSNSLKVITV